jgi:hypothetical protein
VALERIADDSFMSRFPGIGISLMSFRKPGHAGDAGGEELRLVSLGIARHGAIER